MLGISYHAALVWSREGQAISNCIRVCQCMTCIHDENGTCKADEGNCKEAASLKLCPVTDCPCYEKRGQESDGCE